MAASTTGHGAQTKPKKNILRRLVKPALAIVLVTTLAAAWVVVSVLTAKPYPDPTARADMLAITRNAQPDPNAPNRYSELIEALLDFDEFLAQLAAEEPVAKVEYWPFAQIEWEALIDPESIRRSDADMIEQQAAGVRRAVEKLSGEPVFDLINDLLQSPNLAPNYLISSEAFESLDPAKPFDRDELLNPTNEPQSLSDTLLPFLSIWRQYAYAVAARSRVAAESGDVERASQQLALASRLPAVLTRRSTAVEQLFGLTLIETIGSEFEFICSRAELTPQALTTLEQVLQEMSDLGDTVVAIDGERLGTRDYLYQSHTRGGRYIPSVGDQITTFSWPRDPIEIRDRLRDISGYFAPNRGENIAFADELYQKYEDAVREPDPRTRSRLYQSVTDSITSESDRYEYLSQVFPDLEGFVERSWEARARITALGILLAMAEHRLDTGDWPTALNQLVPDYLDAIPVNPLTGDPFEYDHEPGEPPSLERLGIGPEFDD